jgi:hypothetical protein
MLNVLCFCGDFTDYFLITPQEIHFIHDNIHEFKALPCNSILCNQWPLHTSMLKIQGSLWPFLCSRILSGDPGIVACDPSYLEEASCKDFVEAIYPSAVSKK